LIVLTPVIPEERPSADIFMALLALRGATGEKAATEARVARTTTERNMFVDAY
jgi:hypothetical protein